MTTTIMDLFSYETYGFDKNCTNVVLSGTAAEHYWNYFADLTQPAWQLTRRISLQFPFANPLVWARNIMYPMRRLVVMGEDSPENFVILFGPTWQRDIGMAHLLCRLLLILNAEPDSVPWCVAKLLDEDDTLHSLKWNPRQPNDFEKMLIQQSLSLQVSVLITSAMSNMTNSQ